MLPRILPSSFGKLDPEGADFRRHYALTRFYLGGLDATTAIIAFIWSLARSKQTVSGDELWELDADLSG